MNKDFKYKNTIGIESIFPEDIVLSENSNHNEKKCWSFKKLIDFTKPLVAEIQLFFKLNNKEIISGINNPQLIKVGKKINFLN